MTTFIYRTVVFHLLINSTILTESVAFSPGMYVLSVLVYVECACVCVEWACVLNVSVCVE